MLRKLKNLKGFTVHGRSEDLGKAKDFYFDQHYFVMRYLVIETGSWLQHEKTLISTESFEEINYQNQEIIVASPHPADGPAIQAGSIIREKLFDFEKLTDEEKQAEEDEVESNLRSFNEIRGYHIQAEDKEFGHLEDLFVDEENWAIRYLLIDTRKLYVSKTKEEIKNAPEYKEEKSDRLVHRDYEEKLYDHYNEIKYWQR
jgi:uncharacterized protein YrrD